MAYFFGRTPATERHPTDRVFPLHFFEKTHLVQRVNVAIALFVDEVLDPQILKESLENLVKRKGWERLGGRLGRNASGELEWQIPIEFTADRPAIKFVHHNYGVPAAEHASASHIPSPSDKPLLVCDPQKLKDLVWDPSYKPTGIDEYLTSDDPVLGLRVDSFTDKTVVVFQWQHLAFDALGMQYLLNGWQAVLQGRLDDVLTPVSYETDPFDSLARDTRAVSEMPEKHVLQDRLLGTMGVLRWGLGYGVDTFVRAKEDRILCIPEAFWRTQMEKALKELRDETEAAGGDVSKVFLTEGDIITALIWRVSTLSKKLSPSKTVVGSLAMSLRKAFEGDLIPKSTEHPYMGNAFGWGNVLTSPDAIANQPLSSLAREIRRAINSQGTREQHEAYLAIHRASGTALPMNIFGSSNMLQLGLSNWSKAGLFDMDFAAARKTPRPGNPPCRPTYVQEHHGPIVPADGFYIFGKDAHGNIWAQGTRLAGTWDAFQAEMDKFFQEEI